MKAFKAIYKHGHFIDIESKQRLILVQGAEYTISASDNAFRIEDEKLKIEGALGSIEKENWVEKKYGKHKYLKIFDANRQLFFRVGNSRVISGDEGFQYILVCTLLEDLYLYLVKGTEGVEPEDWRLAKCQCELDICLKGGLTLTEKIPAESLNELFSKIVQFYFSLQRSSSANAFDTFFIYEKGMDVSFDKIINKQYFGLSDLRKKIALRCKNPVKFS